MNRAVKFRLKNGKIVTIRPVRKNDYEDVVRFHNKFLSGDGVKFTTQYPGQPKMNKDSFADLYENPNNFFIGAWYNNEMIGEADIQKQKPNHPHFQGMTGVVGTFVLDKFTSCGLGGKFLQILEKWAMENNVHRLEAKVRHTNIRSLGNLIKNGYEISGVKHEYAFINGKWFHQYELEKIIRK